MNYIQMMSITLVSCFVAYKWVIPFLDNLEKKVREKNESKEN